jgi:hypothetical protein
MKEFTSTVEKYPIPDLGKTKTRINMSFIFRFIRKSTYPKCFGRPFLSKLNTSTDNMWKMILQIRLLIHASIIYL